VSGQVARRGGFKLPEHERRRRDAEVGAVRCALCGWAFEGLLLEGVTAIRGHRADAHPDRPEVSRARWQNEPPRAKPEGGRAPAGRGRPRSEHGERLVDLLREAGGRPVAVTELAAALGMEPQRAGTILAWALRRGERIEKVKAKANAAPAEWRAL
jgi:hypothetical protein